LERTAEWFAAGDGQVHGSIDVHQKHKEEVCKYAL
jgi:hypothetical protein